MKNVYEEELKFIANLALEFRLSLKNICKLLNVNPSDDNQVLFYNEIIRCLRDVTSIEEFRYLVYETSGESNQDSIKAYTSAKIYFLKYLRTKNRYLKGEVEYDEYKKCLQELKYTDIKFKKIVDSGIKDNVSLENIKVLAKYRIKHAISKDKFANAYEIVRSTVSNWESLISSPVIRRKLNLLNEYNYEISRKNFKKTKVNK